MLRSFLKFGLLSGGGWLLDCVLLLLLSRSLMLPLFTANFVSSSCAALAVFTVSRLLVFTPVGQSNFLKTVIYLAYTALIIFAASALIGSAKTLSQMLAQWLSLDLSDAQHSFVAKVLITPPQLLANFFVSRFLVEKVGGK